MARRLRQLVCGKCSRASSTARIPAQQPESLERIDLSETSGFFLELLDDTHAWRERLVEVLELGSATHLRATSSYHVEFPPALLQRHSADRYRSANVLLPLTTREKGPLLNLDLIGPGGAAAALTTRASIAALEATYLESLAESSPVRESLKSLIADGLLEAICFFTPARFEDHFLPGAKGERSAALRNYLAEGLGLSVSEEDVRDWQALTAPVGELLSRRLGEPPSHLSSSEEPLLALPLVDPPPESTSEVIAMMTNFGKAVAEADAANDQNFLEALADYGRRFEVVVELEVPLLEPATVKIAEDRPLELSRFGWATKRFSFGDARSAHLEARITDPNVQLAAFEVRLPEGGEVGLGWFESARLTRETLSIYSSENERPYYVDTRLHLKAALLLRLTSYLLLGLTVAATATAATIPEDAAYVDRLALLAVPTTLAAAFVLAREQTTLASRLLARQRLALGFATLALWIVVLIGMWTYTAPSSASGGTTAGDRNRSPRAAIARDPVREGFRQPTTPAERERR